VLLLQNSDVLTSSTERNYVLLKQVFTEANFSLASQDFSAVSGERQTPPVGNSKQKPNLGALMLHLKESTSTHGLAGSLYPAKFHPFPNNLKFSPENRLI